jgi:hypothetical protein
MYTFVYTYIVAVVVVGFGLGFYLQAKLDSTNQDIRLPSAFGVRA